MALKKYFRLVFSGRIFLLALGLGLFSIIRILRPFLKIRVGHFHERIGESASRIEFYLRLKAKNAVSVSGKHVLFISHKVNSQLIKMAKRRVPLTVLNETADWAYKKIRSLTLKSEIWLELPHFEYFHREVDDIPPQLFFTVEEEAKGQELLKGMGIKPGSPFVCMHARDKAYLEKIFPVHSREHWAYHDFRDNNVFNYLTSAKYLAGLGIYVLRMGHVIEQELKSNDPMIIDYATHHRSDFGDIYLSAKCKFFIGSEGGLIVVPWIFNVPVVYTNRIPVCGISVSGKLDVLIHKKLWSAAEKRFLTFRQILAMGADKWFRGEQYRQAGIEIIENTPDEILAAVKEMNARLDGKWKETTEGEELQQRYREIIPKEYHGRGFLAPVSSHYLRANKFLLN